MSLERKLESGANLAIVGVSLLLAWVLVTKFLLQPTPQPPQQSDRVLLRVGSKLGLDGVNWGSNKQTLAIVLKKGCQYCEESLTFHRRVVERAAEKGVAVIAIVPDAVSEAADYLRERGLIIRDIYHTELKTLQIPGAPMIILLDEKGVVKSRWLGKLPPPQEGEVLGSIGV